MVAANPSEAHHGSVPAHCRDAPGSSSNLDDAALVDGARADPRAFAPLYEHYLAPIYRYCLLRLGSAEAAEDATSQVFLKALAGLPNYRGGPFAAWLFRIAQNVVVDNRRRHSSTHPLESAWEPADQAPTPEGIAVARAEREALRMALGELPEDQRTALELQLANWSIVQTARVMDRSPAAVKMLRLRAIRRLRMLMTQAKLEEVDVDRA